jgi:sugar phosphate isomerase/epimerase
MQTRRDFLIAAAAALSSTQTASAAPPNLRFPTAPRDRLAIASYSFRSLIDTPANRKRSPTAEFIALKDFAARMANRYNIRNVELLGRHFPSTEPPYLRELRHAVKAAGSRIVNIPVSVGASLCDPDPARRTLAIDNAKKWVDIAVAVDCPGIRVHLQGNKTAPPGVDESNALLTTQTLLAIAGYGASQGVLINLENDDPKAEDALFIAKVLDAAHHPWLHALPDFCNTMLTGDPDYNYTAMAELFRRAYNISHVKDDEIDGGKTFHADLKRTFEIAKNARYKGWFSIEWEGAGDVWRENEKLIAQSLHLMA